MTFTEPGTQTRDLSLRSTSVHMVSSDSSLAELSSRGCSRRRAADRPCAAPCRRWGRSPRAGLRRARTSPATRRSVARRRTARRTRRGCGLAFWTRSNSSDGLPRVRRAEGLAQHDFVVVALLHALRGPSPHSPCTLRGVWSLTIGAGAAPAAAGHRSRRRAAGHESRAPSHSKSYW